MWKEKFTEYLRYEKNYSSQTEISYLIDLTQFKDFVVEETGSFNPSEIDSDIVRIWMSRLMEQGMKPSSVNRKLSSLKTFFNFLERKELIGKNQRRSNNRSNYTKVGMQCVPCQRCMYGSRF
jgi:integrase/recombinase XerC